MPLVDMVQPPLTTIRIFHDRIGREGVRLLLDRIARPEAAPAQIRITPELIVRASTAAPPGGTSPLSFAGGLNPLRIILTVEARNSPILETKDVSDRFIF